MSNNDGSDKKGEFLMLAVHGKVPFVLTLERKQELDIQANKNREAFLKLMKEMELQSSERNEPTDSKNG